MPVRQVVEGKKENITKTLNQTNVEIGVRFAVKEHGNLLLDFPQVRV
jgi:hypothetical protein